MTARQCVVVLAISLASICLARPNVHANERESTDRSAPLKRDKADMATRPSEIASDSHVMTAAWATDHMSSPRKTMRPRSTDSATNSNPGLPAGRRYYNGRYFGNFNNRFYGPQYGYF